jgi:Ca2+-binding RTX toxin-like protein
MTTSTAWGSAFPVNITIKAAQYDPKMCALKDGSFVAVWADNSETGADTQGSAIRGQLFNADGSKKGAEFLINTTTAGYQINPDVTVLNDGRFVVAWESDGYVWARGYNANGSAIGNEFKASSTGGDDRFALTALTNGGFAVSYWDTDGDIRVQSFDGNLQKSGTEAVLADNSDYTEIVGLQGQYIAFYGNGTSIHGQLRNNDGSMPSGSVTLDISTTGNFNSKSVAAKLTDGRIIVIWTSLTDSPAGPDLCQIIGQILNANGTKSGGELLLSVPGAINPQAATVTAFADGGFAVGYLDQLAGRNSADIHISAFNSNGARVGADTILDETYKNSSFLSYRVPALGVTTLADGRLAVTWDSFVRDWDDFDFGVHGQIVDLRQAGVTVMGTAADDRYYGSRFNDAMKGEAGNDRLLGHEGNDAVAGGLGNDVLLGQGGRDTLTGGDGSDAFVFDTAPVVGRAEHIDRIVDFNGQADKIYLDDTIFIGLSKKVGSLDAPVKIDKKAFWKGQAAHDKDDRIIVKTSGEVLYDVDGTGKAKAVVVAKLDKKVLKFVDAGDFFEI